MNVIAVVCVDLDRDFFGAPGTLAADLAGHPVLRWTLSRLAAVGGIDGIAMAAPPEQADRVRELAGDIPVQVFQREPSVSARESMRVARAFGRYGWRGGLAGTTVYDEHFDPVLLASVIERTAADAVMLVPAGSALLDVKWAEDMLAMHREDAAIYTATFCQSPPGLAGAIYRSGTLMDLAHRQLYPGKIFAYDPTHPIRDPISEPFNYTLPDWLVATPRRFLADSPRGLWLCEQIVKQGGPNVSGEDVCRIAQQLGPEPWPREVTVELTTRRPIEDDLRPWADRPDMSIETLKAALADLAEAGDLNIMFDGAGDALLHPAWPEAVRVAAEYGVVGMATYGMTLDAEAGAEILATPLSVLQVNVDAASEAVYSAHKRGGSAKQVWSNIEAFVRQRAAAGKVPPSIVPAMLKTVECLAEQDEFFECCLRLTGWATIAEPSNAAGQWPDHAVVHMAAPTRTPCRRLSTRLTLLADGRITPCDQDIHGAHALGASALLAAWRGESLAELRQAHEARRWSEHPLCAACGEFHRP